MACEDKRLAFEQAIKSAMEKLKVEMQQVSEDVERRTKDISDKAQDGSDLAQGVGAVAGAAIGGVVAGPGGAAVGAPLGKAIGSLFVIEISNYEYRNSVDLPRFDIEDTELTFGTPTVETHETDIVFNMPTLVMKTVRGPDQLVPVCGWETVDGPFGTKYDNWVCKIESRPTYYDEPHWEDREQRISIGMPAVLLQDQRIVVAIPTSRMEAVEFSFTVPSITIRFVADAGKITAAAVQAVQAETTASLSQKQAGFRDRVRAEVMPLGVAMFDCFKQEVLANKAKVTAMFDPAIEQLGNTLKSLQAQSVPETDDDYIKVKSSMDDLIQKRSAALQSFDDALLKIDNAAKTTLDGLMLQH